jgi:hypothetical protein
VNTDLRTILQIFLQQIIEMKDEQFSDTAQGLLFVADIQKRWFDDLLKTYLTEERKGKQMASMLGNFDAEEVAQQLCLHNSGIFRNIHAIEFLNEIWKNPQDESSPSFKFFVERFDKESYWVATELILCKDLKERIHCLKKFIMIIKVKILAYLRIA